MPYSPFGDWSGIFVVVRFLNNCFEGFTCFLEILFWRAPLKAGSNPIKCSALRYCAQHSEPGRILWITSINRNFVFCGWVKMRIQKERVWKCPHCLYLSEWVPAKSNQKEVPWENATLILQETQLLPYFCFLEELTVLIKWQHWLKDSYWQGTAAFKFSASQRYNLIQWKWLDISFQADPVSF